MRSDPKTGQTRKIFDTISDNAANAGIVVGTQRHKPNTIYLRWVGAICSRNGEVEETGLGAGVLDDPVMGIVWLSERLEAHGQAIRAGDSFHADFGTFGDLLISFA